MECIFTNMTRDKKWDKYLPYFKKIASETEKELKIKNKTSISVILVHSRKIHTINRDYRHVDAITDVISFALRDSEDSYENPGEEVEELGDIFINVDRVVSQAKAYDHSIKREICFLFTHGLLHCLGYDHMNPKDEKKMFALQDKILDPLVSRK